MQLIQDYNNNIAEQKGDIENTHYETKVREEQNGKVDVLNELESNGRSGGSEIPTTSKRGYSRTEQELIKQRDYWQGRKDGEVYKQKERGWGWYKSTIDRDIQLLGEKVDVSPLFGGTPVNYQEKLNQVFDELNTPTELRDEIARKFEDKMRG